MTALISVPLTRRRVLQAGLTTASVFAIGSGRAFASDTEVVISSVWASDKPFQKVVDAFNAKKTGVNVTNRFDGNYEEAAAKALASIAAGRAPDMMITGWKFGYFARRTLGARDFHEIDSSRADAIIGNFKPQVRPLVTIDGALIGLPWAMSTPITWINMDLWKAAGLDPDIPMDVTHDWLVKQATALDAALKAKGHPTYQTAMDLSNNEWTSQAYIQNAGGYIIDPDGKVALGSKESVFGMTKFGEPAWAGLWQPVDGRAQLAAFNAQALAINVTSSAGGYDGTASFEVVGRKFPRIADTRKMNSGGNFLAIYTTNDEQAKAAMSFLEFAASEEGQTIWSEVGYLNTSVYDIPLRLKSQEAAMAQLDDGLTAETIWPGSRGLEAQNIWRQWVARIVEKQMPVADALAQAKTEVEAIIAQ